MRKRPAARILLLNEKEHVLLFHFVFKSGPLTQEDFWATPGGALDEGESYPEAARRELLEETGIKIATVGRPVAEKEFILRMCDGEEVLAQEQFFIVQVRQNSISNEFWTSLEKEVIVGHRWWSQAELAATKEIVYPEDLSELISLTP